MAKMRSNALLMAGAALAGLMPGLMPAAYAAAPQAAGTDQAQASGDDIIVTAQKREQRVIDVPQAVSVISSDLLRDTHSERLDDFLTRIPGAAIDEAQAGQARLILRGINTGSDASTVATYLDETPLGSATGLGNGGTLTPDLDPGDLARIEVLPGPQGTLYGANSLGGLLKYVTTPPRTDGIHASAQVGFESIDHGGTGWSERASLNLPVGDTFAILGSGYYRDDAGYINDPNHGRNVNSDRSYGGRFAALFKPTSALTIRANVLLQNIDSDGPNTVDVDPVTLTPVLGRYTQSHIVSQPSNVQYRVFNGTITYDFGAAKLTSATSWGNLQQSEVQDATALLGTPSSIAEQVSQYRFTEEVRLASAKSGWLDWTLGGYYTRERDLILQNLGLNDATTGGLVAPGLELVNLPEFYREFAGFANGTIHFSPKFDLSLGGRYSHNTQSSTETVSGSAVPGQFFSGNSSDGVFTYSAAPAYHITPDATIYARIAKGYRPGGPNVLPALADASVPREYGSDTTTNYEIGLKTDLIRHVLSVDVTGFIVDWKDIQLLTAVSGFGVNVNGGTANSKGVEFSSTLTPAKGLSLTANGAYIDAKLTEDVPALNARKGDELPYTAKFSSTLAAEYQHALGGGADGSAGVSWRYTGPRESAFDTPPLGQHHLDGFSQIDAHAGITYRYVRFDVFVRNLLDRRGIIDVGTAGSAENGAISAAIVRPRSIGATLGFRY